jgi:hypothetical protein
MDWHEQFKQWAKPPTDVEEAKASKAAELINKAVRETQILASVNFKVYPTGSYRNNTNIKLGSDVDVALVLTDAIYFSLPEGLTTADVGLGRDVTYGMAEFRRDVGRALTVQFGSTVTPGTKTFRIAANGSRLPADATPFLVHRQYTGRRDAQGRWEYHEGVELRPTDVPTRRIINWHDDHYDRGVARNTATRRRFKRVARILKQLREAMEARGNAEQRAAAAPAASFLLECLAYNAPDGCYNLQEGTYFDDVRAVIADGYQKTASDERANAMLEVNGRKLLFGSHQGWTRAQAHEFLLRAWQYVGFK